MRHGSIKENKMREKFVVPDYYKEQFRNNLMSGVEIGKCLGVSSNTVNRNFVVDKVYRNYSNREWLNEQYNILKLNIGQIAKNANTMTCVINRFLKKYGLLEEGKSIRIKKNSYNLRFFDVIDSPEKAYWLGFIYADGHVDLKYNHLGIKLQQNDKNHLVKFKNLIGDEALQIKCFSEYSSLDDKYHDKAELRINNKEIVEQIAQLGATSSKHQHQIPFLTDTLIRHFIRGYFDGDGTLNINVTKENCAISFYGGPIVLNFIATIFGKILYNTFTVRKIKTANVYALTIGGAIQTNALMHYMYYDTNPQIYLERKYNKWYEFYSNYYTRYSLIFAEMQRVGEKLPNPCLFKQE